MAYGNTNVRFTPGVNPLFVTDISVQTLSTEKYQGQIFNIELFGRNGEKANLRLFPVKEGSDAEQTAREENKTSDVLHAIATSFVPVDKVTALFAAQAEVLSTPGIPMSNEAKFVSFCNAVAGLINQEAPDFRTQLRYMAFGYRKNNDYVNPASAPYEVAGKFISNEPFEFPETKYFKQRPHGAQVDAAGAQNTDGDLAF